MNLSNSKFRLLMHFPKLNWKVKGLKTIQIVKEKRDPSDPCVREQLPDLTPQKSTFLIPHKWRQSFQSLSNFFLSSSSIMGKYFPLRLSPGKGTRKKG